MYNIDGEMKVSKNFKVGEFASKDNSPFVIFDYELVNKMQMLRDKLNVPVTIASGFRSASYNTKIGGSPNSRHMKGKAGDIKVKNIHPLDIAIVAEKCGFRGIGVYTYNDDWFVHVDVRDYKSYWVQLSNGQLLSVASLDHMKKYVRY